MISIIVPVYNQEKHVERCLNSIKNQTYTDIEVILVDDGSTDDSGAICRRFSEKDKRFHYIYQENRGVGGARNKGVEEAGGEYISFVDPDDYIEEKYCEILLGVLEKEGADISCCSSYDEYEDGRPTEGFLKVEKERGDHQVYKYTGEEFSCVVREKNHLTVWGKLFKSDCIREIKFSEKVFVGEDTLFLMQALKRAEKVALFNSFLYHYITYKESALNGPIDAKKMTELDTLEQICREFPENESCRILYVNSSCKFIKSLIKEKGNRDFLDRACRCYLKNVDYLIKDYKKNKKYHKVLKHRIAIAACRTILWGEKIKE